MSVSKYGFQVGNKLGGRTAEGELLRKKCRKVTDKMVTAWIEALEAVDFRGEPDHDVRIKAANALADRGYGKPAQAIIGEDGGPVSVSVDMAAMLRRLIEE